MELIFHGRLRTMYSHRHPVTPGSYGKKPGAPLKWETANTARGRIDDVGLSGNFHVRFEFKDAELRNWLSAYIAEKSRESLALLSEMQAAAIVALIDQQSGDQDDGESAT